MKTDIGLPDGMTPPDLRAMVQRIEASVPNHDEWSLSVREPRDESAWHVTLRSRAGDRFTEVFDGPEGRLVVTIERWLMDTIAAARSKP